jgi:hypothetical protein
VSVDYPSAQWFNPLRTCRVCGKPAGELRSFRDNSVVAFMCEKHAKAAISAAHRKMQFAPDAFLPSETEADQ